ncbi:hypothetical protein GQ42DRAFT_154077 [Ramicandelaber brevisporus]|nr:hypothetical protein GQ42DRAFT_154077 [Ramicandelaber brevisporus]
MQRTTRQRALPSRRGASVDSSSVNDAVKGQVARQSGATLQLQPASKLVSLKQSVSAVQPRRDALGDISNKASNGNNNNSAATSNEKDSIHQQQQQQQQQQTAASRIPTRITRSSSAAAAAALAVSASLSSTSSGSDNVNSNGNNNDTSSRPIAKPRGFGVARSQSFSSAMPLPSNASSATIAVSGITNGGMQSKARLRLQQVNSGAARPFALSGRSSSSSSLRSNNSSSTTLNEDAISATAPPPAAVAMLPNPRYMDAQSELDWSMRSILIGWLVQVHERFSMLPETLFLCVNYVDRFLSSKVVSMPKLQLVGIVSLFLAAKYEEITIPPVDELVFMVENVYDRDEILKAERYMFTKLGFTMGHPGPLSFVRRISKADNYDDSIRTCAKYMLEVMMMDERFIQYPASIHAAVSIYASRKILAGGAWSPEHAFYAGYAEVHIVEPTALLLECLRSPATHHKSVYDKYKVERYMHVSRYVAHWMQRNADQDHAALLSIPVHKAGSWQRVHPVYNTDDDN